MAALNFSSRERPPQAGGAPTSALIAAFDLRTTPLREVNAALHAPGLAGEFVILNPAGAHNVEGPRCKQRGPSTTCPVRHWRRIRDSNS